MSDFFEQVASDRDRIETALKQNFSNLTEVDKRIWNNQLQGKIELHLIPALNALDGGPLTHTEHEMVARQIKTFIRASNQIGR